MAKKKRRDPEKLRLYEENRKRRMAEKIQNDPVWTETYRKRQSAARRRNRARMAEDPAAAERHRLSIAISRQRTKAARDKLVDVFRAGGCALCTEKESCCLSAHHHDPSQKEFTINKLRGSGYALVRLELELAKCVCLCENCHRKVHAGILPLLVL